MAHFARDFKAVRPARGVNALHLRADHVRFVDDGVADLEDFRRRNTHTPRLADGPLLLDERLQFGGVVRDPHNKIVASDAAFENIIIESAGEPFDARRAFAEVMFEDVGGGGVRRHVFPTHAATGFRATAAIAVRSSPRSLGFATRIVSDLPRKPSDAPPTITASPTSERKESISVSPAPTESSSDTLKCLAISFRP